MDTPDIIYLIDMGDEIVWADDKNPSGAEPPPDYSVYVKSKTQPLSYEQTGRIAKLVRAAIDDFEEE